MGMYIKSNASNVNRIVQKIRTEIPDINIETPEEAYEMMSDMYDSIEEFCEEYFEIPCSEIAYIVSLHDGFNEDEGIITTDGSCYIAYSGYGVEKVSPSKLIDNFLYDAEGD